MTELNPFQSIAATTIMFAFQHLFLKWLIINFPMS